MKVMLYTPQISSIYLLITDQTISSHVAFSAALQKKINNLKTVSEDELGYFYNVQSLRGDDIFPDGWNLERTKQLDLDEFESFYADHSGGLLPKGWI